VVDNDSHSTSSLLSWFGSRPARALRSASLAALALVPAACGNLDSPGIDAEEGAIGTAAEAATVSPAIVSRRSLEVTDSIVMQAFTLEDVMQQLLTQAGSTQTPAQLFFQMFDSEQPAGAPGAGSGPHCTSTFNGFSLQCPRLEGESGENLDPFVADQTQPFTYMAVAVANRFDLADPAGADCGQYRLVFARRSGNNTSGSFKRNFIIFEALMPNPSPGQGPLGCAPITQFWQNLSESGRAPAEIASELRSFYFDGLPASGVGPVVHVDNYGGGGHGGQIRANEFDFENAQAFDWSLREFTLNHACAGGVCSVVINPATDKVNPSATLFVPGSTAPAAIDFQTNVLLNPSVLSSLATPTDVNELGYDAPDRFNTGESNSSNVNPLVPAPVPATTEQSTDYLGAFGAGPSTLATEMSAKLAFIGSPLTPVQIVNRIQSLACAGCHNMSTVTPGPDLPGVLDHTDLGLSQPFPQNSSATFPFPFTHTSETTEIIPTAEGGDGVQTRFMLSPVLTGTFLPFRQTHLQNYIAALPRSVTATLSFESTWSTGYCVAVNLQNSGATPTTSWHVDLDLDGTVVTSSWNATFTVTGTDLSATNLSWNAAIPAGGALNGQLGFCASRAPTTTTAVRVLAASGQ
jgi:Cellulose binding domain